MKAIDVLDSFIKFAQAAGDAGAGLPEQSAQSSMLQPQVLSGQPPRRQANIPEPLGSGGGNSLYVKPNTKPQNFKA
jgi:hypothetical protein